MPMGMTMLPGMMPTAAPQLLMQPPQFMMAPPMPGMMMPGMIPQMAPQLAAGGAVPGVPADDGPNKRQRVDDATGLVPEKDYLAKFSGETTVRVSVPSSADKTQKEWNFNGQTESIVLPITQQVTHLKEALQAKVGVPAGKINLKHPTVGFLKDQFSLAFYNLGPEAPELQLLLRERGGRKK